MREDTLHIVPAGSFSAEIKALAEAQGYSDFQFYDDANEIVKQIPSEIPPLSSVSLAIGSSAERQKLKSRLSEQLHFPILVHPSVILMDEKNTRIGRGSLITAGSILTTNIEIGEFVIINLQCSVGHDCKLGNFCSLMPGVRLSGGVTLEDGVYLGTNAVVLPNITIGAGAIIGAGAVVTKNVPAGKTYIGIPAQEIGSAIQA